MRQEPATPDSALARLAGNQHGVASFEQITALGIPPSGITRRLRAGRLHRIHRRVYAVGHRGLSNEGRWLAAVLALGSGAALSHRSGAEHLRLLLPRGGPVDVTVPGLGGREQRTGIRIHRSSSLKREHVIRRDGIPVTTPARTLRDLRRIVSAADFRRAVRQAEVLGYGLGGVEGDGTRSELEYEFLQLCRRHRLPLPEVNQRIGPYLVDFLWRRERLVVETDGYRYHRGPNAFEDDRARDLAFARLGFTVRRFTYRQVTGDAAAVAAEVRRLLREWRAITAIRQ